MHLDPTNPEVTVDLLYAAVRLEQKRTSEKEAGALKSLLGSGVLKING